MKIPTLHRQPDAASIPIEQLGAAKIPDAAKVAEVARQFEAVLLRQIFQEARKPVITPDTKSDKTTSGIYDDMINNQLAESVSRSGGLGLAKSLQTQMTHQVLPNAEAAGALLLTPLTAPRNKTSGK